MNALTNYTKALNARAALEAQHAKVFEKYQALTERVDDAATELKAEVATAKRTIENDTVVAKYVPAERKSYDYATVITRASKPERIAIEAGALKVEVDYAKFQHLVKTGVVRPEVERAAFRVVPLSPRVIISIKEKE